MSETIDEVLADMQAAELKKWADRIERALSAQGEAVAWAQFEEGQLVGTSFDRDDECGCTVPLYTHPAPARVTDPWESGELGRSDEHVAVVPEPARVTEDVRREELNRLAERVMALPVREDTDGGSFCAQVQQRKIAEELRNLTAALEADQ